MSIDARIPLMAAQGAQFDLAGLVKQQEDRQYRQQALDLQREQIDWQRELKGIELDKAKAEAAKAGLKDMAAAVQWADTPEKWAQVQQHYGQIDPQLATVPFQAREVALVRLGQMGEYLEATAPKIQSIEPGGGLYSVTPKGQVSELVRPNDGTQTPFTPAGGAQPGSPAMGGGDIPTISSPDEAKRLPPGTQFRTPDGRIKRVPGGGAGNSVGGFQP